MHIAYLLGSACKTVGHPSGRVYRFTPWADILDEDWPKMRTRTVVRGGCCGKPSRVYRMFATEDEIRDQAPHVEPQWR